MFEHFLIFDPFYVQNFALIAGFLILIGAPLYYLKNKNVYYQAAWSSIVSWFYVLPVVFVLFAIPEPGPIMVFGLMSIYALKTFFQMTGIYHRDWFVNLSYVLIALGTYFIYFDERTFFATLPMIALAGYILVAILRNNFVNMVQYIGLSLIGFSVYGWCYLHGAEILTFQLGVYTLIYLYALSEFSIALSSSLSLMFGKIPLRNRINSKIKLEGFIIATIITVALAWSWRRMLPIEMKSEWLTIGLLCSVFSTLGDLTLSVIRKDLKIKDQGVFIIGRGDLLSRVNKVIFVFPAYYYFVKLLEIKASF
jgi:phosphatidate cytidylyltransferase